MVLFYLHTKKISKVSEKLIYIFLKSGLFLLVKEISPNYYMERFNLIIYHGICYDPSVVYLVVLHYTIVAENC